MPGAESAAREGKRPREGGRGGGQQVKKFARGRGGRRQGPGRGDNRNNGDMKTVPEPQAPPPSEGGVENCLTRNANPETSLNRQEETTRGQQQKKFVYKVKAKSDAKVERENDPRRLEQRQKQVDLGKNTLGYQAYLKEIPRKQRKSRKEHPPTPDIYQKVSKRAFDGQIKAWRRALHKWDPSIQPDQEVIHEPADIPPEPSSAPRDGDFEPSKATSSPVADNDSSQPNGNPQISGTEDKGASIEEPPEKSLFDEFEDDELL